MQGLFSSNNSGSSNKVIFNDNFVFFSIRFSDRSHLKMKILSFTLKVVLNPCEFIPSVEHIMKINGFQCFWTPLTSTVWTKTVKTFFKIYIVCILQKKVSHTSFECHDEFWVNYPFNIVFRRWNKILIIPNDTKYKRQRMEVPRLSSLYQEMVQLWKERLTE